MVKIYRLQCHEVSSKSDEFEQPNGLQNRMGPSRLQTGLKNQD